jgi:hypothetical protein
MKRGYFYAWLSCLAGFMNRFAFICAKKVCDQASENGVASHPENNGRAALLVLSLN